MESQSCRPHLILQTKVTSNYIPVSVFVLVGSTTSATDCPPKKCSVADPAPDPACHFDAVPDPDPRFQIEVQNREKVLKIGSFSIHFVLSSEN